MPQANTRAVKQVLARIQRLCCLGVGSEMLVPDLLREVAELIPCNHWAFQWAGFNAEIVNHYSSFPSCLVRLYLNEFCETRHEKELKRPFSSINEWSKTRRPVVDLDAGLFVDRTTFVRSAYYNELWRPTEVLEQLILIVREAGRNHGAMFVYRAPGEVPFTPRDSKMLEAIAGFVAHGMTGATLAEEAFAESDDRALFVAARDGSVQHATGQAQRLLMMALMPRWSPTTPWRGLQGPVPEIAWLCRALVATAGGQIGQPPPVLRLGSPWGKFVLRAYWFGATDGEEQHSRIGITIERWVPRALALRRRIEDLPLTAREKQFCLLLACDLSRQDVADVMGVAASTAITHQRSVYAKLGVKSRIGLIEALSHSASAKAFSR